jgi:hypothetical protein
VYFGRVPDRRYRKTRNLALSKVEFRRRHHAGGRQACISIESRSLTVKGCAAIRDARRTIVGVPAMIGDKETRLSEIFLAVIGATSANVTIMTKLKVLLVKRKTIHLAMRNLNSTNGSRRGNACKAVEPNS